MFTESDSIDMYCSIMETDRIRQFCLVADIGSLTKAADLLHITHSGLSKSMRVLQEELGIDLLRPEGRGIAITDEGKRFYQTAKELLETEERLLSLKVAPTQSDLVIGTTEIFLHLLVHGLSEKPLEKNALSLIDLEPGEMEQKIVAGEVDIAVTYAPIPHKEVEAERIGKFSSGCFVANGRFAKVDFAELPFAVPASGLSQNPLGIKERDGWLDELSPRRKSFRVNLLSTAIDLALRGQCAVFMPQFVAREVNARLGSRQPQLVERAIPDSHPRISQDVFLLRRKGQPETREFKRLAALIRSLL
ncbi:MAG: LysR family transcriptional regulator [Deltaproteobacteria bacterium]|nr:LysR family transcriptional regulator [Deltaproteobacteria bacterium]